MRAWIAAAALLAAAPALAAKLALLVGVGAYPDLPSEVQLQAPPNDVRLMRQVLLQRGFEAANIEVLADGVEGAKPPTRAAILSALQSLAARARRGDVVHVHFSGHGSLQPGPEGGSKWQPVFLPRDARGWDGRSAERVANAITDDTLREAMDRINDRGASVFAVFDACHSARLVRGALPGTEAASLRVRQVAPGTLGVPALPPADLRPQWEHGPRSAAPERGHAVYFYAAQAYELATSLPLKSGAREQWHGLFSWNLAQALAQGQPMSYRQLGEHLLSRQDQQPVASATPLYAGDGLDDAVHGQQAPLLQQWPVRRQGDRLLLDAGALSGLAEGALLVLLADPLAPATEGATSPPRGALGHVRLSALETDRATLEPAAWQGFAAPVPALLPAGTWARLVSSPPSFTLRIAADRNGCRAPCTAGRALAQLQREGVPGVDARWVAAGEAADVRLLATDRGMQLLPSGGTEGDRGAWGYAAPPPEDAPGLETLVQQTAGALHRVAKARNLLRLAAQLALRGTAPGLRVDLKLVRKGSEAETPVASARLAELAPGDQLRLGGANDGADPVDLVAFWMGADQSIRRIVPEDARASSRLATGAKLQRTGWEITPGSEGVERLLVISVPMRTGRAAADFRSLEQPALGRLRGAADPDLQALFDACFADYRARGDATAAPVPDRLAMQVYTFRIAP